MRRGLPILHLLPSCLRFSRPRPTETVAGLLAKEPCFQSILGDRTHKLKPKTCVLMSYLSICDASSTAMLLGLSIYVVVVVVVTRVIPLTIGPSRPSRRLIGALDVIYAL